MRVLDDRANRSDTSRNDQNAKLVAIIDAAREENVTAQDVVLVSVRQAILSGILGPGARLRQEELADVFGTSRIPVREALRALEYEGLVTSVPHRGFTVTALDADNAAHFVSAHALNVLYPCAAGVLAARDEVLEAAIRVAQER
jgi:DNA-binding GntR family transcriptional regulator